MIPRLKPKLGSQELRAALHLSRPDDVLRFESAFAELMAQRFAVAFPYGRTALIYLLRALGLAAKEIICPAYTCVVVPHAIHYSGNRPTFIDCLPGSFNMDLDKAEQAINENTGAIVATSLFGYPVDLDRLDKLRLRHPNIHIIQDCAHSFAAEWKGRPVQKESIAAVFGLNISKILTSIFGGMITTDDKDLFDKLKQLRDSELSPACWGKSFRRILYFLSVYPTFLEGVYGIINKLERTGFLNKFVKYYDEFSINMPSDYLETISKVEARVGIANIARYHKIIENHVDAANHYFNSLHDRPDFKLPPQVSGATYSHFAVKVKNRVEWLQKGLNQNVQLGWIIEYSPPLMRAYGKSPREEFPEAASYADTMINLPVWGGKELAKRVCDAIA